MGQKGFIRRKRVVLAVSIEGKIRLKVFWKRTQGMRNRSLEEAKRGALAGKRKIPS